MTTAARPTFEPARGGRGKGEGDLSALSKQYSSRDLPGHTKIKYRWFLVPIKLCCDSSVEKESNCLKETYLIMLRFSKIQSELFGKWSNRID